MVAKTRLSAAHPDRGERLENAARRSRVKKSIEKAQQEEAFKEMLQIIGKNGGKMPYGEVDRIVKSYNKNGFKAVTRQNLYYRLSKLKDMGPENGSGIVGKSIVAVESTRVTSDITDEQILIDVPTNTGGRKKGSTKQAKKENAHRLEELITKCAIIYDEKLKEAKKAGLCFIPNGTLKKIVNEEEVNSGLSVNTISLETVRSRVKRGSLTAYNKNQQSPINKIEPIIVEFCIRLRKWVAH